MTLLVMTEVAPANVEHLGTLILAAAALGSAAMAIVEALKWTALGEAGFGASLRMLGPLQRAIRTTYGDGWQSLLRAHYRGDRKGFARLLRHGVRAGLSEQNLSEIATYLGPISMRALRAAMRQGASGVELEPRHRIAKRRFDVAVDAHIDAALALGQSRYTGTARAAASIVALVTAALAGMTLGGDHVVSSMVVGVAAVPVAPIAKDLVSALRAATSAIEGSRDVPSSASNPTAGRSR